MPFSMQNYPFVNIMNINLDLKKHFDKIIYLIGTLIIVGILCFLVYAFYLGKKTSTSVTQPSSKNSKEIQNSLDKIYQKNGANEDYVNGKTKDLRNIFE